MNSLSNIEIVNFEGLESNGEYYMDLEREIGVNYMNQFIEKSESDYSDINPDSNDYDSSSNLTIYSDNPIKSANNHEYSNINNVNDSCNNSNFGDATNYSENKSSILSNSICNLEKICNNSFSYLKRPTKFKLNLEAFNLTSTSNHNKSAKMFLCTFEGCEKKYKSKENLTLHYKNIHLKEKPYSCKFCSSVFSHRNGKTYHERKFHTKFLPHKCTYEDCQLSFASKSALSYHMKSQHTNNKIHKNSRLHKSKFNEKIMEMVSLAADQNYQSC